jgi:hypothetical protein
MDLPVTFIDLADFIALFLWGAHMVPTGIQRTFGSKLRGILGEALKARPTAFLAGMGVMAVLQCSTATIWMVSGFAAGASAVKRSSWKHITPTQVKVAASGRSLIRSTAIALIVLKKTRRPARATTIS